MKLDRNINPDRKGKYALILMRKLDSSNMSWTPFQVSPDGQKYYMIPVDAVDFGVNEEAFFVIRLKDKFSAAALFAYAQACSKEDLEFSREVMELAVMANEHPLKKMPD